MLKHDDFTLTVYQGKKNKNVLVLSSQHSSVEIGTGEKKLPETIQFYNETKFGVDVVDQMARMYTVKAGSRRWPVQIFYNILDLAAINAWVIFKEITGQRISRHKFILKLQKNYESPICSQGPLASVNLKLQLKNRLQWHLIKGGSVKSQGAKTTRRRKDAVDVASSYAANAQKLL